MFSLLETMQTREIASLKRTIQAAIGRHWAATEGPMDGGNATFQIGDNGFVVNGLKMARVGV